MTPTGQEYPVDSIVCRCIPLSDMNFVHVDSGCTDRIRVGILVYHVGVGFALPLYRVWVMREPQGMEWQR